MAGTDDADIISTIPEGAIVVGIAGAELDATCVAFGAAIAGRTGRPLHLTHAHDLIPTFSVVDPVILTMASAADLDYTDTRMQALLDETRSRWPEVEATGSMGIGRPETLLIEASEHAYLLVVGSPRLRGLERVLGRSALAVASHASCPVVVVPEGTRPEPRGPIVAAVDGSESSQLALQRAFVVARSNRERLIAVAAWHLEIVDGMVVTTPGSDGWNAVEARLRDLVEDMVGRVAGEFPDVEVEIRVVQGPIKKVLASMSGEAGLIVVGNRGRGGFRGMLLGSVSHSLLESATCPVMVVRHSKD